MRAHHGAIWLPCGQAAFGTPIPRPPLCPIPSDYGLLFLMARIVARAFPREGPISLGNAENSLISASLAFPDLMRRINSLHLLFRAFNSLAAALAFLVTIADPSFALFA